jgi:chromate transporter
LNGALAAITAAVVGVILNLSIWFALHVFFSDVSYQKYGIFTLWRPDLTTLDWRVVVLCALAGLLLLKLHWGIMRVLAISAILGLVISQV